jgi:hypothetical protein
MKRCFSLCVAYFGLAGLAQAQGFSPGGFMSEPRFAPGSWFAPPTSSLLPLGGTGGFVPYAPGPGRGLGVMARPGNMPPAAPMSVSPMSGQRPGLGLIRSSLATMEPIRIMRSGPMGQGGLSKALIRPVPARGMMGGMGRPPVGSYPFRVPPSLLGPAATAPAMAM